MKPKSREVGRIPVDAGDVVCFSMDMVSRLAEEIGEDVDELIENYGGVPCGFAADGNYGVDQVTAVDSQGRTYPVVMVGAPQDLVRLLDEDEPTFTEFYRNHPRHKEIGHGGGFNKELFAEIAEEYRKKVREKTK